MSRKTIAELKAEIKALQENNQKLYKENQQFKIVHQQFKIVHKDIGKENDHMRKQLEKIQVMLETAFRIKRGDPCDSPDEMPPLDEHDNLMNLLSETVLNAMHRVSDPIVNNGTMRL